MKWLKWIAILSTLLFLVSCASSPRKLDANKEIISDQGELTRQELEKAAKTMARDMSIAVKKKMNSQETYIAFLPTRNDTTEEIAVETFDQSMVSALLQNSIHVVRAEDRKAALKELAFAQTGATDNSIEAGKMKSATHFIQTKILENVFNYRGNKVIEHTILSELRSVETQVVVYSNKKVYRKKIGRNQISW